MAGLQYNFFPTDFFYPRPPTPVVDSTPSTAALTMHTQKREAVDDDDDSSRQAGGLVHHRNKSSVSMRRQGEKLGRIYMQNQGEPVKLPRNSLSWLTLIPEELSDSS